MTPYSLCHIESFINAMVVTIQSSTSLCADLIIHLRRGLQYIFVYLWNTILYLSIYSLIYSLSIYLQSHVIALYKWYFKCILLHTDYVHPFVGD